MAIHPDYNELVEIASRTAFDYMVAAKKNIDRTFGEGYAAAHPELVAAFMKSAGEDYNTAVMAVAVQEASDKIESALHAIADRKG
ncbi:hypothetical protein [Pseudomonas soli]|uniref:hypothetical protein n=1 Tax=Pseudomonas soli TaxID=1306993 RepID=UPI0028A6E75E|nr:hypothetical protein [Pseudomonas soli]